MTAPPPPPKLDTPLASRASLALIPIMIPDSTLEKQQKQDKHRNKGRQRTLIRDIRNMGAARNITFRRAKREEQEVARPSSPQWERG